jgi:ABC-2 type transport system ATP-binding protein
VSTAWSDAVPCATVERAGTLTAMSNVLTCHDLVKTFGSTRALGGLDLEVSAGEIHGFLGPNGSGKTVTMRIVLGLLRPDSGTVEVFGRDPWRHAVDLHRRMAYVPGDTNLWPNLTGGEILDLLAGIHTGVDLARRADLIERFDLDPRKKARSYSKGNRQKVALIAALSTDAELLILDEPTAGLDPLMEAVFQELVADLRNQGRAVLLSSHVLAEAEKLCDRVTIIRDGVTVQHGTLDELRHLTRTTISAELDSMPANMAALHWVYAPRATDSRLTFEVDSDRLDDAMALLTSHGLRSLTAHPPTLEELFMRQYGNHFATNPTHGESQQP